MVKDAGSWTAILQPWQVTTALLSHPDINQAWKTQRFVIRIYLARFRGFPRPNLFFTNKLEVVENKKVF